MSKFNRYLAAPALCFGMLSVLNMPASAHQPASGSMEHIKAAVANEARPEKDQARDEQRQPAAVLSYLGIKPGQRVLDMYSGGGYYTELASYVVGDTGSVTAHNNKIYAGMTMEETTARYGDDRLPNVTQLVAGNNELELPADTYDAVLFMLAYHDVVYIDGFRGWEKVDRPAMLAQMFKATRSGGIVGVVDHIAAADADPAEIPKMHRVDPELVKKDFLDAGFVLLGESDLLINPEDNLGMMAMMPDVRGKTSRFVFKFAKP
tara:strand:+ start:41961 stop:42749 length:789 start_codon:yes stop_codon:yes gene_type:complete